VVLCHTGTVYSFNQLFFVGMVLATPARRLVFASPREHALKKEVSSSRVAICVHIARELDTYFQTAQKPTMMMNTTIY
jgi:hypothetical protein